MQRILVVADPPGGDQKVIDRAVALARSTGAELQVVGFVYEHIANLPPLAVSLMKESLSRGMDIANIQDSSLADSYRFMVLELTKDKDEAHKAWREKRKPSFKGE